MNMKITLKNLIFCIPLTFLENKTSEALSFLRNNNIQNIKINKKNNSQSITNFSYSKKNIFEIKTCWEKDDLASQKRDFYSSLKYLKTFDL